MELVINGLLKRSLLLEVLPFTEFIDNLPQEKLLSQLYNFSKNYNLNEALKQIKTLNLILTLENIADGVQEL